MARPLKEGLDYFPHETDASNSEQIKPLRLLHGLAGYGFYFILLERIYKSCDGELDISTPLKKKTLLKDLGIQEKKFNQMLETCIELGLIRQQSFNDRQRLVSDGAKKHMSRVNEQRKFWRENDSKQGELSNEITNKENKQGESTRIIASKVKESKVNITPIVPSPEKTVVVDENYKKVCTAYEENIGMLTPLIGDQLKTIVDEYPLEWIERAFSESVKQNIRKLSYIEAMLKNWKAGNFGKPKKTEYQGRVQVYRE